MERLDQDCPTVSLASWSRTARPIRLSPPTWFVRLDDLLFGSSAAALLLVPAIAVVALLLG